MSDEKIIYPNEGSPGVVLSDMVEAIDIRPMMGVLGLLGPALRQGNEVARKLVIDALQDAGGCVSKAARALRVPKRTFQRWVATVPGLRAVRDGARAAKAS